MGMKGGSAEGEIVQVQGGHIIRSTGRKDRHSKVYTSKGPRDRRVRLSAHTAIEFYDVQDRLGYDRPSKAVDWLIKKAKSAIDNLAELPPWHPNMNNNAAADMDGGSADQMDAFHHQIHTQVGDHNTNDSLSFMSPPPTALDTDTIADSIKSFFPTNNGAATGEASSIHFQNYPADIITRSCTNPSEDLGLSLHTAFQDPTCHHHLHHPTAVSADHPHHPSNNTLFNADSANNNNPNVGFDSNFQRMLAWNIHETSTETRVAAAGGFLFNNSPSLSSSQAAAAALAFAQRGPLQSSFTQSVRAWDDIPIGKTQEIIHHSNSIFGLPCASAGFSIPAYHHQQQQHSDRPSSSSPNNSHR